MLFWKNTQSLLLLTIIPTAFSFDHGLRGKHRHHCHFHSAESTRVSGDGTTPTLPTSVSQDSIPIITPTTVTHLDKKFPWIPNGIKAGIAGGDAYPFMKDHIGWWYDWTPNPSKPGKPIGVPMLWGGGTADATDAERLAQFKDIKDVPTYLLTYEEPGCASGSGSAGMSVSAGSPSMCKQADENWLREFRSNISTEWDITAIHINKNSFEGVKKDIDYYWNTYGKPIWVTEFACVDDSNGFTPCTNQQQIDDYINMIVSYLEKREDVFAYAYSNGWGLGDNWPLMRDGVLSASGRTYLAAISKYH